MMAASARRPLLDATRGLAVVAMVAFHLVWDLGDFGYIDPAIPFSPSVKFCGHVIAESFLFIGGVSLVLAHERNANWQPFWRRIVVVAGAAALVTAGTYLVFPRAFVFFGILHCIALASLLAAPMLTAPWPLAAAVALFVALGPSFLASARFDAPFFWWTGLSSFEPLTNDYRPLLPWSAGLFAGVAAAQLFRAGGWRTPWVDRGVKPLVWLGRHSLIIYLLHQPLLFGIFNEIPSAAPALQVESGDAFLEACDAQCATGGGAPENCAKACACTAERATVESPPSDADLRAAWVDEISRHCLGRTQ